MGDIEIINISMEYSAECLCKNSSLTNIKLSVSLLLISLPTLCIQEICDSSSHELYTHNCSYTHLIESSRLKKCS